MNEVSADPILDLKRNKTQRDFILNPYKFSAMYGGIRNGKTVGACARLLTICDRQPGTVALIGRKTYQELFDTTVNELFTLVKARNGGTLDPGPYVRKWDAKWYNLTLKSIYPGGEDSTIRCRYADNPELMLGQELSAWYLDQAEEIDPDLVFHLESRLSFWNASRTEKFIKKYGFKPKSFGFITGNPDPGWVYEHIKANPKSHYKLFEASTDENRVNLGEGYIEELRKTKPADWIRRFVDGSWDVKGGQVYPEFNEAIHGIPAFAIPEHWPRYIAFDWGFRHRSCCLWLALDERGNVYVYKELSVNQMLAPDVAKKVFEMCEGDPVERTDVDEIIVWMDPSTDRMHGQVNRTVMDEFAVHGILGRKANNSVDAGILKVAEFLHVNPDTKKPRLFIFKEKCPELIKGMKRYQWQPVSYNGVIKEKPLKKDDDEADTLRYGIMAILEDRAPALKKAEEEVKDPYGAEVLQMMLQPVQGQQDDEYYR